MCKINKLNKLKLVRNKKEKETKNNDTTKCHLVLRFIDVSSPSYFHLLSLQQSG